MLVEGTIAGVIISGFAYKIYSRKHHRQRLVDHLLSQRKTSPTALQTFKHRYLDPFQGELRQSHKISLNGNEARQISQAEQTALHIFSWAVVSFVLATIGMMGYPFFYLFSVIPVLFDMPRIIRPTYHDLVVKHKISYQAVSFFYVVGGVLSRSYFELAFGHAFMKLVRYLSIKTEDHSKQSLVGLFGQQPRFVWVWVDGSETQIPFEKLHAGDIIIVYAGQMIPADGTIVQGTASIDQHMLTGEAQPVEKTVDHAVFHSTIILSGHLHIQVRQTGTETVAAKVGDILNQTTDYREVVQSRAETLVEQVTIPTLICSGLMWATMGASQALGILVIFPGYRLMFLNPLSMLTHLHMAAQHRILIKDGRSLELLNEIDTIIFDKTGTLTLEQPHIKQVHCCADLHEDEILQYAATAEVKQSHPIAQAVLDEAARRHLTLLPVEDTQYKVGFGIQVTLNTQTLLVGSRRFMDQQSIQIPTQIQAQQKRCGEVGHSLVMVAVGDTLIGAIELEPTIRPEASRIIRQLSAKGLDMAIISGDHDAPTRHLAEQLGIDRYFAEVLPEEKAHLVEQLENQGHKVCFVGDGINDAIALKQATTSVSLRGATTIATDTAQVVLMEGNLDELVHLFDLANAYQRNINLNFTTTMLPVGLYLGGMYLFGWGFLTATILLQSSSLLGLLNIMHPLFDRPEHSSVSNERSSMKQIE